MAITEQQPPTPEATERRVTARKSYTAAKNEQIDAVFEFDIDGTTFEAKPNRVPGSTLIDFQGLTVTRDPDAMWDFFRAAMNSSEDAEKVKAREMTEVATGQDLPLSPFGKFKAFLDDPVRKVDINLLMEIVKDMVEFTTGRPTGQSSS
jgi:hypothetical protein